MMLYINFPPRESLVNDIPAGAGILKSFFYGVDHIHEEKDVKELDEDREGVRRMLKSRK
jgi:hypothetical protein